MELTILNCVRPYVSLEIPEPVFMNPDGRAGNEWVKTEQLLSATVASLASCSGGIPSVPSATR